MVKKLLLAGISSLFLLGAGCVNFNAAPPAAMGIYRSADKGENWQEINVYPTSQGVKSIAGVKVYRVFFDPSDHNALYIGSRGQGLFYSYNKGDSWQFVPYFQNKFIYGVAVDPTNKCVLYVSDGGAVYKSDDCSRSWKIVFSNQSGPTIRALTVDYSNHNMILAVMDDGTLLQSQNGGASWKSIKNFGVTIRDLMNDPAVPGRYYVASMSNGLYRSDDYGQNWISVASGLGNYNEALTFYRFVIDPSQRDSVYWLSKYGIFHSTDAGDHWSEVKLVTSPGTVNIFTFAVNPKNSKELYYTGTTFGSQNQVSSSKLYKSVDGGVTWFNRKLPSSAVPVNLFTHPDIPNLIYVAFTSVQ